MSRSPASFLKYQLMGMQVLLRKLFFIFALLLPGLFAFGQHDLSGSRRHSVYTYVYRVSEREALTLYQSDMADPSEKYLHSLVDSFKETSSFAEAAAAGLEKPAICLTLFRSLIP